MNYLTFTIVFFLVFSFNNGQAIPLQNSELIVSSSAPESIIRGYLFWYKTNRERLEKFHMVPGKPGDTTMAYAVDFNESENYLRQLKNSNFVSEKYINGFREYFKKCDSNFKKTPQYDGPAEGFGIDLVFKAHDYNAILDNINKMKVISRSISGNTAKIYVQFPLVKMIFILTRNRNTWLIDSLDYQY